MENTRILFGGDFVISDKIESKDILDIEIVRLFNQADFSVLNLEAPITTGNSKILKTGPHLKANRENTKQVLKTLEIDVLTLANNHVLDYDEQGVNDTLAFCKENGIKTVGAGMNLSDASKTLYLDTNGGKIAIINFAENEWSSATVSTAGANPMDIINNVYQIKDAKLNADFVFVITHGGHEYYNLPSPRMQKQYRFYAEQGADIVIGHHTHCINGKEVHLGIPIYYSLGNFLFTTSSSFKDWYLGLVLEVEIENGKLTSRLHPVKQHQENFKLGLLDEEEKQDLFNRISDYDKIIADPEKLQHEWDKYVRLKYNSYLNYWSPLSFINNRYLNAACRKLGIKMINKSGIALKLNLLRCEAHLDISKEVTQKYLKK